MRTRLCSFSDLFQINMETWVDQTRKPFFSPVGVYVPVRDGYPASHLLPERHRKGRGYQKIGDVIAFHGDCPKPEEYTDVIVREQPRGIIHISGHDGVIRTPKISLLWGSAGEVTHRESGIEYRLNVEHVMFSQGNREEKSRVAALVRPGEFVCDMFAGIGYFTLPLAKSGAIVHAIEINPVSFEYLQQNILINRLSDKVTAWNGDCREVIRGVYDRIHMGHFDSISFLPVALSHVRTGTILHVHMLNDQTGKIRTVLQKNGIKAEIHLVQVKKAGPRLLHLVADVVII
ncbi:MAG: SAM-dependent methyltransferase [Methanomicrobiales archaeon HGW-Methanomicrobiales-4]|nr:MAG: SAM-dependent methyltransferase [Methanomicrobiales archaeon HGW-Methanomicrobiales-4]